MMRRHRVAALSVVVVAVVAAAALSAASAVERGEWDRAKSSAEIWCSTHDYAGRPRLAPP
jgi:hypothetical protein